MNVHVKPAGRRPRRTRRPTPVAPSHIPADCRGQNFYAIDPALRQLLQALSAGRRAREARAAFRAARRAGRRAARRAGVDRRQEPADPACPRPPRPRRGLDRVPSGLSRDGADRLRRLPVPRHEPSRRRARPRRARCRRSPNTRCTYLFVQAEFGIMCPISVTDTSTYLLAQVRQPRAEGLSAAAHAVGATWRPSGRARSS